MENVYANVLCVKIMSLPTMNVNNILVLFYFRTAKGEFKLRYNNYTMSFRHKKRKKIQSYQNTYGN